MLKKKSERAVDQFLDTTPVTSLSGVIGFSNATLNDFVKGRITKKEASDFLHVLESGPARHLHATIERASRFGQALAPLLGPNVGPLQLPASDEGVYDEK